MSGTTEVSSPSTLKQSLPYIGLAVGVWALAAPYVLLGPDLNAASKNEFADHVVPGLLMIVLSAVMLGRSRSDKTAGTTYPLIAGFGIVLAGIWMTATHLPLVRDARNDIVDGGVAAWHTLPGLVVLAVGLVWAATFWSDAAPPAEQ